MNPHIFKEYDIRAIVEKDLPGEVVFNIGKAYGSEIRRQNKKLVNVGRDCRLSSDDLFDKLTQGILSTGCDVRDIGICTTPILYFSIQHFKSDGGIMITGSHNDKEYNGFKLCVGQESIYGPKIQELKNKIIQKDFETGKGKIHRESVTEAYSKYLLESFKFPKKLKVVVDAGNGTGGEFSVPVLKKLGCDVTPLYCDMDGNFPNHHPDPTVPENLKDLAKKVLEIKADVGIAYDGDSDRIGVVDESGNVIFCDYLMVLFAEEILSRKPGAIFISEVKCSKNMYQAIEKMGGKPIMWKTGHSLIKAKMRETKAELAGELSGHIFFKDRYFGFDDAIYATCRLLEILSKTDKKISSFLKDLPKTFTTPEIRFDCPDDIKFKVVEKATQYFKSQKYPVVDVDGARVTIGTAWGLIRASNTSPVLVLRFEADTSQELEKVKGLFLDKLKTFLKEVA